MTNRPEPMRAPIRTRAKPTPQLESDTELKVVANAVVGQMQVEQTAIEALRRPPIELRNPDKRQQPALKSSIQEFGILKPILVDQHNVIIAGYAVWKAAKAIGLKAVPTICISHLTPEQIRLYRIADNQIATLSSFDDEMLRIELGELSALSLGLDPLNLELTGFSTAEIDNQGGVMSTLIGQRLKGRTKSVLVEDDGITISYRVMYHGFKGDKRIPFRSITSVQFREPGWLVGYIQLSIKGAVEWHGDVLHDENAIEFDKPADQFHALRDLIQAKMSATHPPSAAASVADELSKLVALRDQGVLTKDEFISQKAKLLR